MSEIMIIWFFVGIVVGTFCSNYGISKGWSFSKSMLFSCIVILLLYIIVTTIDVVINGA